jgi:hypothetical protein
MSGDRPSRATIADRAALAGAGWNAAAAASDDAWLWHRYEYVEALGTWPGREDRSFALLEPGGAVAAVVPFHVVDLVVRGVVIGRLADSFGGPALASTIAEAERPGWLARAVEAMRDRAREAKALWLDVKLPTLSPRTGPGGPPAWLEAHGFADRSGNAYVVDLAESEEARWASVEKRVRTSVRKAEKLGVRVRETTAMADLDSYYALHRETYRRTRATPHPRAYFEAIWHLAARGDAMVLVAEVDGRAVAAATFGIEKATSLYWTGANSAKGLDVAAGPLLQWTALARLAARGVRWHEVGEAFPKEATGKARGLDLFKRGFGGTLHPVHRGRLVLRPRMYRALQAARRLRAQG